MAIDVLLTGGAGEGGEKGEGEGSSVLEFLLKLQKEQDLMKGYVYAPFRDVVDRLDDTNNSNDARENDAKTTLSISRRQIFNWLPPPPPSHHHLSKNPTNRLSRTDCGLLWNFLQLPPTNTSTSANHNTNPTSANNTENDENPNSVKI